MTATAEGGLIILVAVLYNYYTVRIDVINII